MKINRIVKLQDCRIFRDYTWPAKLADFDRLNLIYGWNASGKTTLSTLMLGLERGQNLLGGRCILQIDGHPQDFTNISEQLPNIRVFNRDTARREIFEKVDAELPPVFVFGEVNVEKSKNLDALKAKLQDIHAAADAEMKQADVAANELENFYSDRAKAIKNLLTTPGGSPYNNYDKGDFKAAITNLQKQSPTLPILTDSERDRYLVQKDSKPKQRLPALSQTYPNITDLTKQVDEILKRSVASKIIQVLVENTKLASWVREGLELHREGGEKTVCKFCGQSMPQHRIHDLEAHFNDEFKKFQAELTQLHTRVGRISDEIKAVKPPTQEQLYDHLASSFESCKSSFSLQRQSVLMYLTVLHHAIEAKQEQPFKSLQLNTFLTMENDADDGMLMKLFNILIAGIITVGAHTGADALTKMGQIVQAHNKHCENFGSEIAKARRALEQDEIAHSVPRYLKLTKALEEKNHSLGEQKIAMEQVSAKITHMERELQTHTSTAVWLTGTLASYLGRRELVFEARDTGYAITRDGVPAMHLSEGERMAIAFLYFLRSLRATSFDLKNGIVVIDDPVSSMDENSIYSAFGYMKQHIEGAGQIFVLTHNFRLFSLVRNWFNHFGKGKPRKNRNYMLEADYIGTARTPVLSELDPLLRKYETEYHYLFKKVSLEATKPPAQPLESCYPMPNIARRLLESFLAYRCPGGDTLHDKMSVVPFDDARRARLFRFVDVHSHDGQLALEGHDISILRESRTVMNDLLAFIEAGDPSHFKLMVEATED